MAIVGTYLNFPRNTEGAFNFYKTVFQKEFSAPIMRFGDNPPQEGQPPIAEEDKNLVMHVSLEIMGGHFLMGTDAPESMGFKVVMGNNTYICLTPDTRAECDRIFAALSEGGTIVMPLQDQFWGDYYGILADKYGIQWMFNFNEKYLEQ